MAEFVLVKRSEDFNKDTKKLAILRQRGICAFCGVSLKTPWTDGEYQGEAHHLKPIHHGGTGSLDNCVYLCYGHHKLLGHAMAPFGIDKQGGDSRAWVQMDKEDFPFWGD